MLAASAETPLLEAVELAAERGGRRLFEGLALALHAGDLLLVRGPNGSGKSSILRLLAGLLRPAVGAVQWTGRPVADDPIGHRGRLHLLGGTDGLKPVLTAAENLRFVRDLLGGSGSIDLALKRLGIAALRNTPVRNLSTGQRRRAVMARLVAVPRPLWLLDEPETGLDRAGRATLEALIAAHRAEGGIVVVATHAELTLDPSLLLDLPGETLAP